MADRLELNPSYLAAVIGFETAYTYSPKAKNPLSGATGLIQFMPSTATSMGTSTEELARMTAIEQLEWVEEYYRPYAGKVRELDRPGDYYMAVFMPNSIGKPYMNTLFTKGSIGYQQNQGLDYDKDGKITIGDLFQTIDREVHAAEGRPPIPLVARGETPCS